MTDALIEILFFYSNYAGPWFFSHHSIGTIDDLFGCLLPYSALAPRSASCWRNKSIHSNMLRASGRPAMIIRGPWRTPEPDGLTAVFSEIVFTEVSIDGYDDSHNIGKCLIFRRLGQTEYVLIKSRYCLKYEALTQSHEISAVTKYLVRWPKRKT